MSMEIELPPIRLRILMIASFLLLKCDGGAEAMLPVNIHPHDLTASSTSFPIIDDASWDEDDAWWDGAEEIDLTIPFDQLTDSDLEAYVIEENGLFFNESFFSNMECEDFMGLPSPPVMEEVPPPPLPPFLIGMGEILQESLRHWHKRNTVEFQLPLKDEDDLYRQKLEWVSFEDNKCSICAWAHGGNETIDLLTKKQADANVKVSHSMVIILVGVALISAVIGATVMGAYLRCKKVKSLPCGAGRNWFRSANRRVHTQPQEIPSRNKNETIQGASGILPGFAMKLWRRGSSQAPLNPHCSSPGSENSYSEEPYINTDASSATYAEMSNTSGQVVRLDPSPLSTPYSNTYSEIPSPVHSGDVSMCSRICGGIHHEGTYENSGYLLSENPSDPNESSTGSNSTPSSAYYSDVSSSDAYTNKKKKKKRKGDDRPSAPTSYPIIGGSLSPSHGVPVICSHVSHQPVHLNLNAVQSQYIPSRETIPVTLQLLPRQIEQRISDNVNSSTGVHNQNFAHNNMVHHNPRLLLNIRNHPYNPSHVNLVASSQNPLGMPEIGVNNRFRGAAVQMQQSMESNLNNCPPTIKETVIPEDSSENPSNVQEELILRQYNGNVVQRPLPPLPSRQANDPRRRNFKVSLGPRAQNIPSDV